jgi:23S rRNA pseudouridine1911/1915/1917 synthase
VIVEDLVPDALDGERLDRVVAVVGGIARSEASSLVEAGRVALNGVVVTTRTRRVVPGDAVRVDLDERRSVGALEADASVEFDVVYDDEHVIVVNKAPGLVVHPGTGNETGTLVHGLLARYPELAGLAVDDQARRPGIVHRLDKGTSGLLMVGRSAETVRALIAQLADRSVSRRYLALAWGVFDSTSGLIDAPVGRSDADPTRMAVTPSGKTARTRYQVKQTFTTPDPTALLECWLETGRTHQIRVHLAAIGHPVVGDARYGGARNAVHAPRPLLHAAQLSFDHPVTGVRVTFDAPLPADLNAVLAGLS